MLIKDLFKKQIDRSIQGVVTIGNENEEQKWQELEEYVCTDEITKSFRQFFRKYRESIINPTEKMGVWVTGFFGSGKSHFLKILGYILENEEVAGTRAVSYFDDKVNDQMVLADIKQSGKISNKVVLFNIDSKAKSDSKNKSQAIMDIMLRAFNESVGYCGSTPWVADMERALEEEGTYKVFVESFENLSKKSWKDSRAIALLNRDYIIKALMIARNMTEESAKHFIDDQVKNFTKTTEDFAKIVNKFCKKNKTRVVFLMDEVGQFIGDNGELMLNLQTCVEDLGKFCKGQAWVIVTSQQELKAMLESTKEKQRDFSKIQGRFDTRILLSGSNADEVIKKRILDKKEIAITPLKSMYDASSSKLSNLILFQQKPTWSGYKDAEQFMQVYPFVSYQFELLQKVFESIREHGMSEGKHLSQNERSLLSAFQESAKEIANQNAGLLVPFDSFYKTIEQFIDYDVKTVFTNATRKTSLSEFAIRVLKVLFMIKHVKEMPATLDRLATLMVESINEDKAALKAKILNALKDLEAETLIQKNGEEYDFLTNAEQDVNRQINNSGYNEGEVKRTILDLIYDKVLESNKYRHENRYEFGLNRFVDEESKGSFGSENITIKIITTFSSISDEASFQMLSVRESAIVVDLTEGGFIDELIKANRIATFKRNNSATMSATITEIMSKKTAEYSDRLKRAEEIIRQSLRKSDIYINGTKQNIKEKDGKDRLGEALKIMVEMQYFKLNQVSYFYPNQTAVTEYLDSDKERLVEDLDADANCTAYKEIIGKIKNDKQLSKRVSVKALVDYFTKKPYGWRDIDILGMIGVLWKNAQLQISIHDNIVEFNNRSFKNDFAKKNGLDTMIVKLYEKIDENILYQVKRIMSEVYNQNFEMSETKLSDGVRGFFDSKKKFLQNIRDKHGVEFAGSRLVSDIYKVIDTILKANDTASIFEEIISRKENLEKYALNLEQLESFYKDDSNQQKNFENAKEILNYYNSNKLVEDLSQLDDIVENINKIVVLEIPFDRMNDLSSLVFKANEIKQKIVDAKLLSTKDKLEQDQSVIAREAKEALSINLPEEQKQRISKMVEDINITYASWGSSLNANTRNMDSYITSSANTLERFRRAIAGLIAEPTGEHTKSVKIKCMTLNECVPVANKKIRSKEDIDKVIKTIKDRLTRELESNDELDLI